MTETLRLITPVLGASTLAWVAYYLVNNLRLRPKVGRALEDFYASAGNSKPIVSRSEQIGERIAERLPFSFDSWEEHLKWAQRGGYFKGWGIGRLIFTAMLYASLSVCDCRRTPLLPRCSYPWERQLFLFSRCAPKPIRFASVLYAACQNSPSWWQLRCLPASRQIRLSSVPQPCRGPASGLLSDVLAYSRSAGQPLFGRKPIRGALVEVFSQAGLPELMSFATQLNLVAEKGVAGAVLMNEVARTLGREYRSRLDSQVEKLNGRLMLATAVFFFIPFVLIILGSFIAPVMAIFK